jgi:hypothetical protein
MAKLLVLGATGYVGGIVTRLALEDPSVTEVIAPTRRPLALEDPRLKNPIVNFDALDEQAPWWRVDAAISALGTTTRNTPSRADYEKIETSYPVWSKRLSLLSLSSTSQGSSSSIASPVLSFL